MSHPRFASVGRETGVTSRGVGRRSMMRIPGMANARWQRAEGRWQRSDGSGAEGKAAMAHVRPLVMINGLLRVGGTAPRHNLFILNGSTGGYRLRDIGVPTR